MEHSFNTEFAFKYGIEEAIIFGNIYYWCLKNKENEINLKKGSDGIERYYSFNSIAAIQAEYNYIGLSKVYRVIGKLEKEGLIITGCFNKRMGDRTRWYAVTEKGEQVFLDCSKTFNSKLYIEPKQTICNLQNEQISKCNLQNETNNLQNETNNLQNETNNLQNETTLPNINTNVNSDVNTNIEQPEKKPEIELRNIWYDNYKKLFNKKPDAAIQNSKGKQDYWAIITRQIKNKLKKQSFETLKVALEYAIQEQWILDADYALSAIFSDNNIANALSQKPHSKINQNTYQQPNSNVKKDLNDESGWLEENY